MSITRLQQARQMFRHGGDTMGGPNDKSNDGLGDTGDFGSEKANVANTKSAETNLGMDNKDRAIANQYKNMPTPTVTLGVDKFDNPITVPTTYTAKRNRQKALDALNAKGISSFDPRITKTFNFLDPNNLISSFASKQKQFGLFDLALMAATGGLFGAKAKTAAQLFGTAKRTKNLVDDLSTTFGIENPISNMFSGNNKSKSKSTSKNNTNNGGKGDGEGLASLKNQGSNYDEYILLLQKLQSGTISDVERNRYIILKSKLGI